MPEAPLHSSSSHASFVQAARTFNEIWRTGDPSPAKDIMTGDVLIVSADCFGCFWGIFRPNQHLISISGHGAVLTAANCCVLHAGVMVNVQK